MEPRVPTQQQAAAYEATHYVAHSRPERVFLVGEAGSSVGRWLAQNEARNAVILTAWNPFSQQLSDAQNAQRQASLLQAIRNANLRFVPADGRDPTGAWDPEPGYCVFDVSMQQVDDWLQAFEQNAVVLLEGLGGCTLVWHPACR